MMEIKVITSRLLDAAGTSGRQRGRILLYAAITVVTVVLCCDNQALFVKQFRHPERTAFSNVKCRYERGSEQVIRLVCGRKIIHSGLFIVGKRDSCISSQAKD
jgi:hypothetical protein